MRTPFVVAAIVTLAALGCQASEDDRTTGEADLVGGHADLRWSASGYLARGTSMETLDRSKPAYGATLIAPNVVVTAAHCVVNESATFAFGAGELRTGPVVRVIERHLHPSFHPEGQGSFDPTHALRMYDVASRAATAFADLAESRLRQRLARTIGAGLTKTHRAGRR